MSYQTLQISINNEIATVSMNRPEVHNAMNTTMIQEITNVFTDLNKDPDIRIIILNGNGPSFSAGVDIGNMKDMGQMDWNENVAAGTNLLNMFSAVDNCSKPIIGKVHGYAYGGGFGLCTVCDIVVAAENTSFSLSEILIGIIPAVIGPYTVNKIGNSHFRSLGISGEKFDGEYACQIGLVHYSVKESEMDELVESVIQQLFKASPQAILKFKDYCHNMEDTHSAELIADIRATEEAQEGLNAFLEKRPPRWVK